MNFNDEGQVRGFYIHDFSGRHLVKSRFVETPWRSFLTIEWDEDDVERYLTDGVFALEIENLPELVVDSIVRIRYSCTSEQKKRLNIPMLQNHLYGFGAFYVADIEAESTVDVTNRGLLSEESDPLLNLKKWLDEKCFKDADKIVELAEPIIAEAMKQSSTAEIHGVFKPVSISVKNYRNYKEESFDFSDISFCAINGVNGAGKSSLFMDAIVDCLFEETREGDSKAWIRGAEDARSGSIEFIFDIGDKRFRVVRTRTKSGRPTLNLSQMDEAGEEWLNLSKERIIDTQAEIEKILGMDSMTFRSCALIMQDQYGLFLQAKKEERMGILGNLLGLGIYGVMESEARSLLGDAKRVLMAKKEAVKIKNDFISSKGNPEQELKDVSQLIDAKQEATKKRTKELNDLQVSMANYELARKTLRTAEQKVSDLTEKRIQANADMNPIMSTITDCESVLKLKEAIIAGAEEHEQAKAEISARYTDVVSYEAAKKVVADCEAETSRYQNIIDNSTFRKQQIYKEIGALQMDAGADISSKLDELEAVRLDRESMMEKRERYNALVSELKEIKTEVTEKCSKIESELSVLHVRLESYKKSEEYIDNSGCPDIRKAACVFLRKAKEDVQTIPDAEFQISVLEDEKQQLLANYESTKEQYAEKSRSIGYDPVREKQLNDRMAELSVYQTMKKQAEEAKLKIARLEAERDSMDKTIGFCTESLSEVKIKAQEAKDNAEMLLESVEKYHQAEERERTSATFAEEAKKLPVYEERRRNAYEKMESLQENLQMIADDLIKAETELAAARHDVEEFSPDIERKMAVLTSEIHEYDHQISDLQITKGTLIQKVEDIRNMKEEIVLLNDDIARAAQRVVWYDALKQAFSQDGVPHQIVRNIIPHITNTANNILGAMTGGTMGVEFVMERTIKGKDGDKATLDVLINEYGKTTLPYASKSGGEKVKASLAVILALAEVKTTAAGIQLGMLFIDEPPFLDDDGTQAYVDSLETIRQRYPDIKIMAITHDEAMKARFVQSVTVIKTEEGSKVIY
jgi:exonuclease SbcC